MSLPTIEPGDLLAYLDGVDLPHVAHALQTSAALRAQLANMRQREQGLRQLFGGLPCPDPQDLVDVAANVASPTQQLRVAAYTRLSPAGQQELAALLAEHAPPTARRPRFTALPQMMALGARSLGPAPSEQAFYASALAVQVVLRLSPPTDARWHMVGYVTQQDQPAPHVRVTLRAEHARPRPRFTDAEGFFTFPRLSAGVYRLQAHFEQGVVLIPTITLDDA
ncbi:MAG: carboxypeptidase-like regulatory domain-containing protein [Chloroflexales bacterium]